MYRSQEVNLNPSFTSKEILSKSHYAKDLVVAMNAPCVVPQDARWGQRPRLHSSVLAQQEKFLGKYLFAKNF